MKIEVHVRSISEIAAAKADAEAQAGPEDEVVMIVNANTPVERQPMVQAVGTRR